MGPIPLGSSTPWVQYPLPLQHLNGNLVKAVKASLLKELEKNSSAVNVVPCDSTWIVDVMAILQAIKVDTTMTYKKLAHLVFNTIVRGVGMSSGSDWVVDTNLESSIKNAEEDRRTTSTAGLLGTINSENQRIDH